MLELGCYTADFSKTKGTSKVCCCGIEQTNHIESGVYEEFLEQWWEIKLCVNYGKVWMNCMKEHKWKGGKEEMNSDNTIYIDDERWIYIEIEGKNIPIHTVTTLLSRIIVGRW